MPETWKLIPGWDRYQVSDQGRVRNQTHVLNPGTDGHGYPRVILYRGDGLASCKNRTVHRLVLEAFVGPCPNDQQACHNNGDKIDNRLVNLRWDTRQNNMADQVRHGTARRGERGGKSKLTWEEVDVIREAHGLLSHRRLAEAFGINQSTISRAVTRRYWFDDNYREKVS